MRAGSLAIGAVALAFAACEPVAPSELVAELASPAAPGSAEPNLATSPSGRVYLSWIEPRGSGHALRFAVLEDGGWSSPRDIAAGTRWFVNWADFPSLLPLGDSGLAAHWLEQEAEGAFAYGVRIARSEDGGATWSAPVRPHTDPPGPEHGFVSLWPAGGGRVAAAWLDGRGIPEAEAGQAAGGGTARTEMTLRAATIGADGSLADEAELDDRVCDCCQTAAALTSDGPVVVYRDRSPQEVRDIYTTRLTGGAWTPGRPVTEDGWAIDACPVNGPAVAASGRRVAVAWFTMPEERRAVYVAFSDDAGASFAPKIRVDDGSPVGRVALVLEGEAALVSWLEESDAATDVRVRRVTPEPVVGPARTVTSNRGGRPAGFPRIARAGERLVVAWTLPRSDEGPSEVRTATVRVP